MAVLEDRDIGDLVTGTLNRLGRGRFQQVAQRIQHYEAFTRIFRQDRMMFGDGTGIERRIQIDHSNTAKMVGLFEEDQTQIKDTLINLNIPWRHTKQSYGFERREILMNRYGSRIVDLLRVRRTEKMIDLASLCETQFWNKPTDSSDKLNIFGVPYWVVKGTGGEGGGGNASGFTGGPGGIDRTVHNRWANWADTYVFVEKQDAIKTLRRAYRETDFRSPVSVPDFRRGTGRDYRLYVTRPVIEAIEEVGEGQNENLGRDIAAMDGYMTFRRNPIVWIPELDKDTQNPIYLLNFDVLQPVFLRGDFLRESTPRQTAHDHNAWEVFIDITWNVLCVDPRRCAVVSQA